MEFENPYNSPDTYKNFEAWCDLRTDQEKQRFAHQIGAEINSRKFKDSSKLEFDTSAKASRAFELCYPFVQLYEQYTQNWRCWNWQAIVWLCQDNKWRDPVLPDCWVEGKSEDDYCNVALNSLNRIFPSSSFLEYYKNNTVFKKVVEEFRKKDVRQRIPLKGYLPPLISNKENQDLALYYLIARCLLFDQCADLYSNELEKHGLKKKVEVNSKIAGLAGRLLKALGETHINDIELNKRLKNLVSRELPSSIIGDYYESRKRTDKERREVIVTCCINDAETEFIFNDHKSFPSDVLSGIVGLVMDLDVKHDRATLRDIQAVKSNRK